MLFTLAWPLALQLTHYVDILSVPKRILLEQLSFFAQDPEQRDKCVPECCPKHGSLSLSLFFSPRNTALLSTWLP